MKSNVNITEPNSDKFRQLEQQESIYYESAKMTRKEILSEDSSKTEKLMHKIEQEKNVILEVSKLANMESPGGVENVKIVSLNQGPSQVRVAIERLTVPRFTKLVTLPGS
jgi:E3 ubiquitin-protein ligase SHPRH